MLKRVLIANRGEIAVRILRACRADGVDCVLAASEADVDSLAARAADAVVTVGPANPSASYLNAGAIVSAAILSGCDAIHPGYGFLSEQPELAELCARHGIGFVGPPAAAIRRGGDKMQARALAESLGIPVGAGSNGVGSLDAARAVAERVGYPLLLKAAAGGGGRGMRRVDTPDDLAPGFLGASAEAQAAFGDGRLYIERYVVAARHVELQILADRHGHIVHLGDRDCSYQRRYQKLVEEAPAAALPDRLRRELAASAISLASALDYVGAATVEFLVDTERGSYSFLEVNTRIQVEHPVTEVVTGIDIVREQLRIAAGMPLGFTQDDVTLRGHAIEFRINAEHAEQSFLPSPGRIETWEPPSGTGIRVDSHCHTGYDIPPHYDSLLAKLICSGATRAEALEVSDRALEEFRVAGVATTLPMHRALVRHPDVRRNHVTTRWIELTFLPEWTEQMARVTRAEGC